MKNILVMYPDAERYKKKIEDICKERAKVMYLPAICDEAAFREAAQQADAIIGDPKPEWLRGLKLSWLQISWAGAGPYVKEESLRETVLTNASGAFGETIAEHVLGLVLSLARRIPGYVRNGASGVWQDCGAEWNLKGKQALVLGVGDLGNQVALRLAAFGMQVTGLGYHKREANPPFHRMITEKELDEALKTADLVCGCLPGTEKTAGMLSKDRLERMKKDSMIVNVGRGSLIDTAVLTALLQKGHFWGVGLDVTEPEPLPKDHPLWTLDNVIITPHVAGVGFGHDTKTVTYIWEIALSNLTKYCNNESLRNIVDKKRGY